jgi:dolichol kinase
MSNWKVILLAVVGTLSAFHTSYRFFQNWPVLGFLFAAFGCLLLGSFAWVVSDRIRTSETPIRHDNVTAPVLTGFCYFMLGWSVVIVIVAVLQGFGVINWNVRL